MLLAQLLVMAVAAVAVALGATVVKLGWDAGAGREPISSGSTYSQAQSLITNFLKQGEALQFANPKNAVVMKNKKTLKDTGNTVERYTQTFSGLRVHGHEAIRKIRPSGEAKSYGSFVLGIENDITEKIDVEVLAQQTQQLLEQVKEADAGRKKKESTFYNVNAEPCVYLKENGKAVLGHSINYAVDDKSGKLRRPFKVLDTSGGVLQEYEGLSNIVEQLGTGCGGNDKVGRYMYGPNAPMYFVSFESDTEGSMCTMETPNVRVVDLQETTVGTDAFTYPCFYHGGDETNGACSPINDCMVFAKASYDMFNEWYGVDDPIGMQIIARVHFGSSVENAFWDGSTLSFGDGDTFFHPLCVLDVAAHELAHGVTEVNSNLWYTFESGGMNEAFSDMAGQAAKLFYYKPDVEDWGLGRAAVKGAGALRYMDDPPSDGISIDHLDDYVGGMDVHYSSGVYNKAFYLMATSGAGWSSREAFDIFLCANIQAWTLSMRMEVNNNGRIHLWQRAEVYHRPDPPGARKLICPYAGDVSAVTGHGGQLGYRLVATESATACHLRNALQDGGFVNLDDFTVHSIFLATWSDISCYNCTQLSSWQTAILTDGMKTFALFLYGVLGWPQADTRNTTVTEENKIPFIGFDRGNWLDFYEAADSRTTRVRLMDSRTNVGVPGVHIFEIGTIPIIDTGSVTPGARLTCDPLPKDECLVIDHGCVNGVCNDYNFSAEGTTNCTCEVGYIGEFCETDVDDCRVNGMVCENDATCVDPDFEVANNAQCLCPVLFTSDRCEIDVDECTTETDQCVDNATCENLYGSHRCICPSEPCNTIGVSDDDCDNVTCANGGTCVPIFNGAVCRCPPPWFGINCTKSCPESICTPGWEGDDCDIDVDECAELPCFGGLCTNTAGSFDCECTDGWDGPLCAVPSTTASPFTVQTQYGLVAGRQSGAIRYFRGIPYAKPPVGSRRFQAPTAPDSWNETLSALSFKPACPQSDVFTGLLSSWIWQHEDCLFLNIYAPAEAAPGAGHPVIFFISGLSGQAGDSSWLQDAGAYFAEEHQVVFVSINYRLGAMGFFSHEGSPLNNGLRDIIKALSFVRSNIGQFGGDPANIIPFGGDGFSSVAVDLLNMLPDTRDAISRCIKFSGSWRDHYAFRDTIESSARLISAADCAVEYGSDYFPCCMQNLRTHQEITAAASRMRPTTLLSFPFAFDPSDRDFFPNGVEMLAAAAPPKTCLQAYDETEAALFKRIQWDITKVVATIHQRHVEFFINEFYLDPWGMRGDISLGTPERDYARTLTRAYNDISFYLPAMSALYDEEYGSTRDKTDQYLLLHSNDERADVWPLDGYVPGTTQLTLLSDTFRRPVASYFDASEAESTQDILAKFISTFIHYGSPWTSETKRDNPKTKKFSPTNVRKRTYFSMRKKKMSKFFSYAAYNFFSEIVPQIATFDYTKQRKSVKMERRLLKKTFKYMKKAKKFEPN